MRRNKTFSSRVSETEEPFKDILGYPSNPLNPLNPSNLPIRLNSLNPPNLPNPPNPPSPPNPSHPPNPRFKDSHQHVLKNVVNKMQEKQLYPEAYTYLCYGKVNGK